MRKLMVILIMLIAAAVTASADDLYRGYNRGGYELYVASCDIKTDGKPTEAFITVRDTKYNFTKIYNFQKLEDLTRVMKRMNDYVTFDFVEKILGNEELIESYFCNGLFIEEYYVPNRN